MPRAKSSVVSRNRHRKVLKLTKGYRGAKSKLYRVAKTQLLKSLAYAYRDRRNKKREIRKLWIARINAAARMKGISYSRFMNGLKQAGVNINRKMLAEMAVNDAGAFGQLVDVAKSKL